MIKTRPLTFEQLEDRFAPAVWGNPWPDGAHLTLSFGPDGTTVGGTPSTLFKTLNAVAPTAVWENVILRAVQTWAVNANLNVGVVADNGAPLGAPGQPQGDPRFGDIRVVAVPMAPDVMAITTPFDPLAGTWSGDVRLNSNYLFGVGGSPGIDLFTAMLHEAGHIFGLPDNSDPTSVEYRYYQGVRPTLSPADVAALQALYGPRQPDAFEGAAGNGSFATAAGLNLLQNPDGSLGIQANADITTLQEADYYRFVPPLNIGSFTVRVHTTGLSLLESRLTVYDSGHHVVGSAVSTDPLGGDLTVTVNQLLPLGTYYAEVQGASSDVFGTGSYQLQVHATPVVGGLLGLLNNTVSTVQTIVNNTDLLPNNNLLTALLLQPLFSQPGSSYFNYTFSGNLIGPSDIDYFRVQATTPPAGTPVVLTAMVWGTDSKGLLPHLTVYDASGNAVNAQVLVNENGTYTVQLLNATPGAAYFIRVDASSAPAGHNAGGYKLAVQFGPQSQTLLAVTSGALGATQTGSSGTLTVQTTELFHFVLSAAATGNPSGVGVQLAILDAAGNVVASLPAPAGQPVSLTVLLAPGTYRFRYTLFAPAGQTPPRVTYSLSGVGVSDPIGPRTTDPTEDPQSPPPSSGGTTSTGSTSTDTTSTDTSSTDTSSTDPNSTDTTSTDPSSTDTTSTDPNSTDPNSTDPNSTDTTSTDPTSTDTTSTDPTTGDSASTDPTASDGSTSTSTDSGSPDSTWTYKDDPSGVQPADPSSTPVSAALLRSSPPPLTATANETSGGTAAIQPAIHSAPALAARTALPEQTGVLAVGKGVDPVAIPANSTRRADALPPATPTTPAAADELPRVTDHTPAAAVVSWTVQAGSTSTALPPDRLLAGVGETGSADAPGRPVEIPQTEERLAPVRLPAGEGQGLSFAVSYSSTLLPASRVGTHSGMVGDADGSGSQGVTEEPAPQTRPVRGEAPTGPGDWERAVLVGTSVAAYAVEVEQGPTAEIVMPRPAAGALAVFSLGAFATGIAVHWGEPATSRRDEERTTRSRRFSI